MNNVKLQWKKLSTTSPYQILFGKENINLLQNILSYKISEFEIDNLPSNYIISFIEVLQNYIFYYLQNNNLNNQNTNLIIQNNNNDLHEIISSKNIQIEKLNKKIIEYQEIINQKDKLLNDTNKKLFSLYNQFTKIQGKYKLLEDKYENEIRDKKENNKEMDDKLIETFEYLASLFKISNEGLIINKKQNSEIKNKLNSYRIFNYENNRIKGDGFDNQFSSNINNNTIFNIIIQKLLKK